jgi:PAS domain S-box-containing protein
VTTLRRKNELDWIHRQSFHVVPFNVAVIDRDYNVVEANDNFTEYFGEWRGRKCYEVYKKLDHPCENCLSRNTFDDGETRVIDEIGIDRFGNQKHYVVQVAPLRKNETGEVRFVVEMSSDITETSRWQNEYQIIFDRVPCFITVIDSNYRIIRSNEAFRTRFGDVVGKYCYEVYKKRDSRCPECPARQTFKDGQVHSAYQLGIDKTGGKTHYVVSTSPLGRGSADIAHVIEISTDITETKKLEKEVIEAERLAAVGQTVAGLAHSVKNILMGLEGGKYIVSVGLKKDDKDVIAQGWEMLERNFDKTTSLVKDFLSFAKGKLPETELLNPNDLVQEIVDLYREVARQSSIELKADLSPEVIRAPLDPKGIHTCLTNLVSNAMDACLMSDRKDCSVIIRTREEDGNLIFEVEDTGAGIDYDIKKKIFTTFFTTKGGQGTGLGLLTTRKIVQEHGGKISVDSKPRKGALFRMVFPHDRLNMLHEAQKDEIKEE